MGSEWKKTTIGSFCPFVYGKGLPRRKRNEQGRIKVYGANGPVGVHDQALVGEPGIVIGRKGTVGAVHFVHEPFWSIDTTFYVTGETGRDLRYTYYLLKSVDLNTMNADSAVPGLNRNAVHAREISVPGYSEQRAIAHILGTLDDKIELNRRMNGTLEGMARPIFKSWFVDFDPVVFNAVQSGNPVPERFEETAARYRENPETQRLPQDLLDLFPDRFEDSELGEIPAGWEAGVIGDIASMSLGGQWGKEKPNGELVPAICLRGCDMEDLRREGYADRAPIRFVKKGSS